MSRMIRIDDDVGAWLEAETRRTGDSPSTVIMGLLGAHALSLRADAEYLHGRRQRGDVGKADVMIKRACALERLTRRHEPKRRRIRRAQRGKERPAA